MMKKRIIKIENDNNFIGSWLINTESLSEIINYFNSRHENHEIAKLDSGLIDKSKRNSIELIITPKEIEKNNLTFFKNYFLEIKKCFEYYHNEWNNLYQTFGNSYVSKFYMEKFLIGGHHIDFHFDRINISAAHKALTWITFLNDSDENDGSFEFKYFNGSIKPKKGLTIIFPSDWTHAHRQNTVKNQDQFIIKGNIQLSEIEDKKDL